MKLENIHPLLKNLEYGRDVEEGASILEITKLESYLGQALPDDYKSILLTSNGFDASCGQWGFCLYRIDEILEIDSYRKDRYPEYLPKNMIQIGGDGGGEILILDMREEQYFYGFTNGIIVMDEYLKLGKTINEFIENYYQTSIKGFKYAESLIFNTHQKKVAIHS